MISLKERKEAFVTGHDGSSPWEILLIISTTPIGLLFYQVAAPYAVSNRTRLILWETISFMIPMVVCESNWIYPWGIGYLAVQLVVAALARLWDPLTTPKAAPGCTDKDISEQRCRAIMDTYRASLMYLTFIAILAVDFRVFPRRFVKTETHGYSLMDVGAGSFVCAAGLISPRSRGRTHSWRKTVLRTFPLVVLGLVRLLTHKGLDYQEHASEYGLHWNFFFTMAMLSPVSFLIPGPGVAVPCMVLLVYQLILSSGLQTWVVTAPRTSEVPNFWWSLFVANREGLLGCVGYTVLYLISEWIGYNFVWKNRRLEDYALLPASLGSALLAVTQLLGTQVSRRTTNGPFTLWILFVNMAQFSAIAWAMDTNFRVPLLFKAVNQHGLVMFVIANLLTGLTNLSINTLDVPDIPALIILFLYVHVLGAIAYVLSMMRNGETTGVDERKES